MIPNQFFFRFDKPIARGGDIKIEGVDRLANLGPYLPTRSTCILKNFLCLFVKDYKDLKKMQLLFKFYFYAKLC